MKLDTISLSTSIKNLQDFDKSRFTYSEIHKPNGLIVNNYALVRDGFGLERLNINMTYETVSLIVNSKILNENYSQGFVTNTLDQLLSELNNRGAKLNPDCLANCKLKRIDVTDDIPISKAPSVYFNALNHIIAPKFFKTVYDSGIVFKEKIANQFLHNTFYSKEFPTVQDRKFFRANPIAEQNFRDSIRMETKLSSASTIRKYLGNRNLTEILEERSINSLVLDKIIGKQFNFPSFICLDDLSSTEEKNLIYAQYLSTTYNGDRKKIADHIQRKLGKRTKASYQLQQLDKHLAILQNNKESFILDDINELRLHLESDATIIKT